MNTSVSPDDYIASKADVLGSSELTQLEEFETSVTMLAKQDSQNSRFTWKRCSRCQADKPSTEFAKSTRESSGFQSWCKECLMDYGRKRPKVYFPTVKQKTCSTCRVLKNAQEFCKDVHKPTGLRSQCRECRRHMRAQRKILKTQTKQSKKKQTLPTRKRHFDLLFSDVSSSKSMTEKAQTIHAALWEQHTEHKISTPRISDCDKKSLRQWALFTAADLATVDSISFRNLSMTTRFTKTSVDWNRVDRELDSLASDFRTQRFDSLKHVVEILSAVDPKDLIEELTASKTRLEALIENVVEVYHNGFNLGLQNYSKILHLFNESREQVDSIQLALQEARRRLGAQNLSLENHWQRSVKLDTICKILEAVESLSAAPAQIDLFQAQHDWPSAVSLLIDSCNRMNRKELENIEALDKLKDDLETRWKMLLGQITDEIEQMVFSREACQFENDKEEIAPSATPSKLVLKRISSYQTGNTPKHNRFSSHPSSGTPSGDKESHGLSHRASSSSMLRGRLSFKLTESSSAPLEQHQWPMETLIDCLSQMGSLSQAKETLRRGLMTNIKSVIASVMQRVKKEQNKTRDVPSFGPQQQLKTIQNLSIPPVVAESCEELLSSVCNRVQLIFHNLLGVFKLIALKESNPNSLLASVRPSFFHQDDPSLQQTSTSDNEDLKSLRGMDYLDAACLDSWNTVQEELIQIVAEMLNIPLKRVDSRDLTDSMARVWLNRLDEKKPPAPSKALRSRPSASNTEKQSRLSFSFGINVETLNKSKTLIGHGLDKSDMSYAKHIREVLDHPGGAYLVPVVYKTISLFLSKTKSLISLMLREYESSSGTLLMDRSKAVNNGGQKLKTFLENFIMETFLPQIWVDFRGRVTASMEDPEAFRPQIRTRSCPPGDLVLRAGTVAEKMVTEVMSWLICMPQFASSLTGVIENILGRVHEAFANNVNQILSESTSGKLATNQELAFLMMLESDAELISGKYMNSLLSEIFFSPLSDPAQFYVVGPGESVDHSSSPPTFPAGSMESDLAETEVIKAAANERAIPLESIIARPGNFWKMVQLAALSDTLDFVAHCIAEIAFNHPEIANSPSSNSETVKTSQKQRRNSRKSSSNLQLDGLSTSLAMLIDRYRSLSGICIRCMRLEMITLCIHHLSELSEISHLCDEEEQKEIPAFIGALIKNAARAQEEITPHLSQRKIQYILNILPSACSLMLITALPDFTQINQGGIDRMQRILSFLKPAILSLLGTGAAAEGAKYFDRAEEYFSLLSLSVYDLLNYVRRFPGKFTVREFKALLSVHVPGRRVIDVHFAEVESITEKTTEARLKKLQQLSIKRNRSHSKH
eukprot:g3108.t1